jgi:GT2 family glycosyltransferase
MSAAPAPTGSATPVPEPRVDPDGFVPEPVVDLELEPDPSDPGSGLTVLSPGGDRPARVWVLGRRHGAPAAFAPVDAPAGDPLHPSRLRERLEASVRTAPTNPGAPRPASPADAYRRHHRRAIDRAEPLTVVVCTRDRPDDLARCLASLRDQDHPRLDVLVVDNAPTRPVRELVDGLRTSLSIRYVLEPRPGLSRARNRALAEVGTDVVAFLDDDEVADHGWATEVGRAFLEDTELVGTSGVVIPGEIASRAQARFEAFGGHSKGRGFTEAEFRAGAMDQSPLYPLPPFGVGANMAFRRDALLAIGGFDEALGAGTSTRGGEDTLAFTELLLAGATLAYRPTAVTRHFHRATEAELAAQLRDYGLALTAFYAALVVRHPRAVLGLVALVPRAVRDVLDGDSLRNSGIAEGLPAAYMRANLEAMPLGPVRYAGERWRQRGERRRRT